MLDTLMEEVLDYLENLKEEEEEEVNLFRQVQAYEGQFEDISEYMIVPPTVFVEITAGDSNSQGRMGTMVNQLSLYITTNHVKGKSQSSILKLISKLRGNLHGKYIGEGTLKVLSYRRLGNFPGFITYEMNLTHTEA